MYKNANSCYHVSTSGKAFLTGNSHQYKKGRYVEMDSKALKASWIIMLIVNSVVVLIG